MDVNHNLKTEGSNKNSTSTNDIFTKRQTDRRTAEALKKNILGLVERGIIPSVMDIRYVKLAEYENREEELNRLYSDLIDCPRAGVILTSREMDYIEENDENYE